MTPQNADYVLIDDDERTWFIRESYPVILDSQGLVIGSYGCSHSEALHQVRGDAGWCDGGAIAAQVAPNGEVFVLPEGEKGPVGERVLSALKAAQNG